MKLQHCLELDTDKGYINILNIFLLFHGALIQNLLFVEKFTEL